MPGWKIVGGVILLQYSGPSGCSIFWVVILSAAITGTSLPSLSAQESSFDYLTDPASSLKAEEVLAATHWQPGRGVPSFGYASGALWIRVNVPENPELNYFRITNPWLNDLTATFVSQGRIIQQIHTGSYYPTRTRSVDSADYVFPVPQGSSQILVRVMGENATLIPFAFYGTNDLVRSLQHLSIMHGLYYGIVFIVLLYNLVLFVAMRRKIFLHFIAYGASLALTMLCSDGTGMQFLWPNSPWLQNMLSHLSVNLTLFSACLFATSILNLKKSLPWADPLLRIMMLIALGNGLLWLVFPLPIRAPINASLTALFIPVVLAIGMMRAAQGYTPARFWVAAHGVFLLGAMIFVGYQFGLVSPTALAQYSIQIGSTLELAILSIGLSSLMLAERRKRISIQQKRTELANRVRKLHTENQLAEEYRQLQRSLQQAQKLKTIGQMTGGFAHDFNNILAGILGFAELAEARASNSFDPKLQGFIDEITQAGIRGRDLVKQLMIYSRGEKHRGEAVDLLQNIRETIPLLRGSLPSTIEIQSDLNPLHLSSTMDANQLQQVLVNLTLNAAEAMQHRGNISIRLEQKPCQNFRCASCLKRFSGDYAVLQIEDSGSGIQGDADELFTPFYTTKEVGQGSGLGLSVVHGIVHEAGGHLKIRPRNPVGTQVSVFFPLKDFVPRADPSRAQKILLVEDDESVRRYFEALLNHESYDVTVANLSTIALEKFISNPQAYDLIITDQVMPHMTGLELARDMHALRADIPIILCSANPGALDGNDLAESGITAIFSKPLEVELLLAKIKSLLNIPNKPGSLQGSVS